MLHIITIAPIHLPKYQSIHHLIYSSTHPSFQEHFHYSIQVPIHLPSRVSIHLSIYTPIYPCIHHQFSISLAYLPTHLSVHPSIHHSMQILIHPTLHVLPPIYKCLSFHLANYPNIRPQSRQVHSHLSIHAFI